MNRSGSVWMLSCLALLSTAVAAAEADKRAASAEAQSEGSTPASSETGDESGIAEIIVTAQKRRERVQDIPMSITAVGGETIERLGMSEPADVLAQIPNVSSQAPTGTGGYPVFNIRGVTLLDFSDSNEPSVSIYVDDIYLGSPAVQNQPFFDVERIEVLRGPQGTLYGRNATGGLVHFISRRPTPEFEGSLSSEYGSYDEVKLSGVISGPLADSVRGRVAASYGQRDGWQKNLGAGGELGGIDQNTAVRGLLDIDLSEDIMLSLRAHYAKLEGDERGGGFYGKFRLTQGQPPQPCSAKEIYASECTNGAGFRDPSPDPEHVYSDERELPVSVENSGGSVRLVWNLGGVSLTSITGYEAALKRQSVDGDVTSVSLVRQTLQYTTDHEQLSQELRLNGQSGRLAWIAGAYYYSDDRFLTTVLPRFNGIGTYADQEVDTTAVFTQATWALSDQLNLTGGLRYTQEDRDLQHLVGVAGGVSGTRQGSKTFEFSDKISADKVTGRVALDWKLDRDLLVYSSVSTGFKSGAFNTLLVFNPAEAGPVDPEGITAYELGLKSTLLDGRATANLAAFYYDYRRIQAVGSVKTPDAPTAKTLFINVGDGEIYGLEGELAARPIDGLTLSLGVGLLHTEISAPADRTFNGMSLDGNKLVMAPKIGVNGIVRYEWPLAQAGFVSAQTDFQWQDRVYFGPDNLPTETQDAYGLINFSLGWASPLKSLQLDGFIKNLSDKRYATHATDLSDVVGINWGMPRTLGVRLKYAF